MRISDWSSYVCSSDLDDDFLARLIKKTLFVGIFAYIIGNWNALARIVFESFAGLGLKASGTGFTAAELLQPGRVAQVGLDAGRPILDSIAELMGFVSFFENFRSEEHTSEIQSLMRISYAVFCLKQKK